MLVFLVGALLGALMGGALCVRYLRQEIAANIGPKIRHIQLQLDNILGRAEPRHHHTTRHAKLSARLPRQPAGTSTTGKTPAAGGPGRSSGTSLIPER